MLEYRFRIDDENGQWLDDDIRLGEPNWKLGDRIPRGRDEALEVVEVATARLL